MPPRTQQALRLAPGDDLRRTLEALAVARSWHAAFVVAGIGSLRTAALRLAGAAEPLLLHEPFEILSLQGTLSPDGAHLHMAIADASGRVRGGHVSPGCEIRTTAEILVQPLPGWRFARRHDPGTGFAELVADQPS